MKKFTTSYMDAAVFNFESVLERAQRELDQSGLEYDTLVGTGFSGGLVIPALALRMDKHFLLIRKENDDSHHGGGRLIGTLGERWVFVDDFTGSGRTKRRVIEKVEEAALARDIWDDGVETTHVADYYYQRSPGLVIFK